ncbi:FKBP-type peptidyl-prolyl cis-trans isomerase SlyD [Methanococcoides vulcani]|uniref:Peptidyl-prolyl cis-trans isomerase n=2 Tax=Methanococcoides vulcani TaxID=1353158 RepID=A0A1H9ZF55_9EURY|nr:FKBP-type peptidyl-prolyl cis-trans isomerase SlyD [Methanococcoides vulcani]
MLIPMKKAILLVILAGMVLISGCASNSGDQEDTMVNEGDYITVNYIGQLEDGTIFDTSLEEAAKEAGQYNPARDYSPLGFTVGAGQMIKGFDDGVLGMEIAEERTVTIPAAEAYGEYDEELVQPIEINHLKEMGIEPEVGMPLHTQHGQVTVAKMNDTHAFIDYNHHLAGKTLVFKITLVSIGQE